ncbi:hypothetical protein [Desulfogranum marinum]|jgi:hypothetical protein|uniref:hypothetical protein n=1 Tax=Desulfogranum marinum TaxID=453220 RepID=UPI0019630615|nr:hypothetical protein [Desulfogranum marinum]MBM9511759.1 hypothetical protein [Desulfogranum marinum]
MLFGLNRATDEKSLQELLEHFSKRKLTDVLVPRMTDDEINQLVEQLMGIMRNHLSDEEYHSLLLDDPHHRH